jgi:NADH dehydrogenase FAD-containing subunit
MRCNGAILIAATLLAHLTTANEGQTPLNDKAGQERHAKVSNRPQLNVAIVGAGITGALAAYELAHPYNPDISITVYEALSRVGGRVKSFRSPERNASVFGDPSMLVAGAPYFFEDD